MAEHFTCATMTWGFLALLRTIALVAWWGIQVNQACYNNEMQDMSLGDFSFTGKCWVVEDGQVPMGWGLVLYIIMLIPCFVAFLFTCCANKCSCGDFCCHVIMGVSLWPTLICVTVWNAWQASYDMERSGEVYINFGDLYINQEQARIGVTAFVTIWSDWMIYGLMAVLFHYCVGDLGPDKPANSDEARPFRP